MEVGVHVLVPRHEKMSDADKKKLLEKYSCGIADLPKILRSDAGLKGLEVKEGDVIRIVRNSPTAGEAVFYRGVIDG
ncbi:MAG: DNA-directed RNA polymerase subunit H [Nitrosarchaeum sp.]|nr:DNA-directed RNA polymerase subunit H [Nitrosarchaeum sp.]